MSNSSKPSSAVGGKFHPPLFFGIMVGMLFLSRAFARPAPASKPARIAGAGLSLLGIGTAASAVSTMFRLGTTPDPHQPVTALAESGPYRFTRNPIYLSMIFLYSGVALLANAIWGLIFAPLMVVAFNRGIVFREEAYLEQKFGRFYQDYKTRVPRWIIK